MALGGYEKAEGKRSGGIRSLALAAASDVAGAVMEAGVCTGVTLKQGAVFRKYGFKEGEACFTEEMSIVNGVAKVAHGITFALERPDGSSAQAIAQLAAASEDGIVAIVTTNGNVSFLVGYSDKFGTEQPLRLTKTSLSSGAKPADGTADIIVLASQDDSKAPVYAGPAIV